MYISLDGEQRVKDKENFYWDPGFTENRATHSEGQRSGSQGLAFGFPIERTPQTSKHGKEKWPGKHIGRQWSRRSLKEDNFEQFIQILSWLEIKSTRPGDIMWPIQQTN